MSVSMWVFPQMICLWDRQLRRETCPECGWPRPAGLGRGRTEGGKSSSTEALVFTACWPPRGEQCSSTVPFCHDILPHPRPRNNGVKWPWTETTKTVSQTNLHYFVFFRYFIAAMGSYTELYQSKQGIICLWPWETVMGRDPCKTTVTCRHKCCAKTLRFGIVCLFSILLPLLIQNIPPNKLQVIKYLHAEMSRVLQKDIGKNLYDLRI